MTLSFESIAVGQRYVDKILGGEIFIVTDIENDGEWINGRQGNFHFGIFGYDFIENYVLAPETYFPVSGEQLVLEFKI